MFSPEYIVGNNVEICIMPKDKAESDRLFAALSAGGEVAMPMEDQFWGDYFGACVDKYGNRWMINCPGKAA
jgi:PhnB protein